MIHVWLNHCNHSGDRLAFNYLSPTLFEYDLRDDRDHLNDLRREL